jgi:hypothetical protein
MFAALLEWVLRFGGEEVPSIFIYIPASQVAPISAGSIHCRGSGWAAVVQVLGVVWFWNRSEESDAGSKPVGMQPLD